MGPGVGGAHRARVAGAPVPALRHGIDGRDIVGSASMMLGTTGGARQALDGTGHEGCPSTDRRGASHGIKDRMRALADEFGGQRRAELFGFLSRSRSGT